MVFLKSPSDYQVENATWRLRLVTYCREGATDTCRAFVAL